MGFGAKSFLIFSKFPDTMHNKIALCRMVGQLTSRTSDYTAKGVFVFLIA